MAAQAVGIVCPGNPTLGRAVFELAGIPVARAAFSRFSDGESHVVVQSDVAHRPVFVFQSGVAPANESVMELLMVCDALKQAGARRLIVVMPFVPYRRQEKQTRPGESLTLRLLGELMQTAGVAELITLNLHRPQTVTWLARQVMHLSVLDDLVREVGKFHGIDVVCAPDNGAIPLAQTAAQELGAQIISLVKHRTGPDQVAFKAMSAGTAAQVAGKRVLVVDDEIDTGATVLGVVKMLKVAGARSVTVAAVHGVLSGPAAQNLKTAGYDKLFLTDTVPFVTRHFPKVKVFSAAPVLAEAVARRSQWL